jgi:hypothetical protein
VILVAVAGFAVVILAAGSITLLAALLLTALPAALLPAARAALLAAALAALLPAALVLASLRLAGGIPSRIALRLVAFFRITLRSVAIRHVHASCIQLLGKDSPGTAAG